MITNVVPTGSNPGGLLKYLMDEKKDYELIGGNIGGTTYQEIMQEWKTISQLNPRTDKDTKHISLSPHHSDHLTDSQWLEIGEKMAHGLGYTDNLWLIIKHKPTESQLEKNPDAPPHAHLMIHTFECESGKFNRINDWRDKTRAEKLTREIEKQWNLHEIAPSKKAEYSIPSTGQCRRYYREQNEAADGKLNSPQPIVLRQLQAICTEALSSQEDLPSYISHLEQSNINVEIATKKGQPVGISYKLDGVPFAGSKLGKNFSWTGLQKQGMLSNPTDPSLRPYFKEISQHENSTKIYTQKQIVAAASDQPSLKIFIGRLQHQGIDVKFKVTRNKVIQGIRYGYKREEWRASQLKDATLPKLQKVHKVDFNKKRDLALIESVNAGKIIELTDEEKNLKTAEEKNEITENFALLAAEVFNHKAFEKQRVKGNLCGTIGSDYYLIYEPKQKTFSVHNQEKGEILTIEIGSIESTIIDGLATTQDVEKFQTVLNELNRQAKKEELVKQSNLKQNQLEM